MNIYNYTNKNQLSEILKRPSYDYSRIAKIVAPILEKVKRGGDKTLRKLALEYDHVELDSLWVEEIEFLTATNAITKELKHAIGVAKDNIWQFHKKQEHKELIVEVMPGIICKRRSVPIEKVGLYVPGGTAPLFSSVLMLGIPAILAGCKEIVLSTPTDKYGQINPAVLYTAELLGIKRILKLGGAHAIAAMAYGTETVPKVNKIFGPGNQYVTVAKQMATHDSVSIDMPAGPSEVMVVVDEKANPAFVAADLLSQLEHGKDSQAVLLAQNKESAEKILGHLYTQLENLPRKDIINEALKHSIVLLYGTNYEAIEIINEYGPEHLILNLENSDKYLEDVVNAGSVFIGAYTPESAGDYASGTNHTLPTNGWAKSYSGVSVDSFMKNITYQTISEKGLISLGPTIEIMAETEQLLGHKNAVTIRLNELKK